MVKVLTGAIVVAIVGVFAMALPAVVQAGEPHPNGPCFHGNPTDLCDDDGDGIVVVVEEPGENCPAGGVKIIVVRGEPDEGLGAKNGGHHPDPADEVFFVCNGQDGQDGVDGEDGAPGENGTGVNVEVELPGENCANGGLEVTPVAADGTLGTAFFLCNGADGAPGPTGPTGPGGSAGPPGITGPQGPPGSTPQLAVCASTRIARWRLVVRRAHRVRNLRAWAEGRRAPVRRGIRRGRVAYRVRVDLGGLPRGIYTVRVRYRVDRGNGRGFRRSTKIHYYRTCYGNPLSGFREGPNTFPITTL